jgi:ribonuclease R
VHKNGNGFVVPDREGLKDIFIPSRFIGNALHGDTVTVRPEHVFCGKKEGIIVDVIKRNTHNITGFISVNNNMLYVIPEDERYNYSFAVTSMPTTQKIAKGDLVAAHITKFPGLRTRPECEITRIFRKGLGDISAMTDFVVQKYDLPGNFTNMIESEAAQLSAHVVNDTAADLRNLKHVTIDGEFAKDFDDAVCIHKCKDGFVLFVSIADVSSYVSSHSHLDREAYRRGTSIYFPGKVLPMLPKILSNNFCSINPREDKLTLTVEMRYDTNGNLIKSAFYPSIIRSTKRFTYQQVEDALIRQNRGVPKGMEDHLGDLEHMAELTSLLMKKRKERGSLDFDLPEPEVILNIEGGIRDIIRSERLFSHQIVEEFMVAANEAVARFLEHKKVPTIYRIHERPDKEKRKDIEKLLHLLPVRQKIRSGSSSFQAVLQAAHGTDYEFLINRVLLRSMKQARYSAVNKGHFGLASDCYLHFTSPIRRYPDLVCHRSLKHALNNMPYFPEDYEKMAVHLSERERVAMEAEREFAERIKILFMKDKLGNVYTGIISHVTSYGFFVELKEIFVE